MALCIRPENWFHRTELSALKKITLETTESQGVPAISVREISLLKEMKNPNIVKLLNVVYADGHKLYLVFEFLDLDCKEIHGGSPSE
jgi:cyclin-dependent kinase